MHHKKIPHTTVALYMIVVHALVAAACIIIHGFMMSMFNSCCVFAYLRLSARLSAARKDTFYITHESTQERSLMDVMCVMRLYCGHDIVTATKNSAPMRKYINALVQCVLWDHTFRRET